MRKLSTKVPMMVALLAAGLLLVSGQAFSQTWPDGCGVSVNGVLGTCQGTNCANWDALNRIYRGGILMTCEAPVGCAPFSAATNVYDAYYYESPTPDAECNCIEVIFNNGACGVSVHSALYAGIVTAFPSFSCSSPGYYQGLADQGSSLAATYSGELPPGGPTNNPGMYTVLNMSNFGTASRGCTYDYTINCRASNRSECALAPIEAKLDALAQ